MSRSSALTPTRIVVAALLVIPGCLNSPNDSDDSLGAPTGLRAIKALTDSIHLVWNAVPAAEQYTVYRCLGDSGASELLGTTTQTALIDSAASHDSMYTYAVSASNSDGESARSDDLTCPHPQHGRNDIFDPLYRVHSPNGGEVFYVGDICTVKVTVQGQVTGSILTLAVGAGRYSHVLVDGLDPGVDSLVTFTVQESVSVRSGDTTAMVYGISEACLIRLVDYEVSQNYYQDYSDCYFAIRRR